MWIKVCGLTSVENALQVAAFQPDAIGLNFYSRSSRRVDLSTAGEIAAALPKTIEPIGLFVNHSTSEILEAANCCGLKTVQLHGDESPEFASSLKGLQVVRAIRVNEETIDDLENEVHQYLERDVNVRAFLVDARVSGAYGGTGHSVPWELVASRYNFEDWPPLILAGGLGVDNIQSAIEAVRPWGVDVASGVESSSGVKSPSLVEKFVLKARHQH
ncbi:phosphoribosylanthranilate isomerase [Thalassoglobus sp. JC818]|uniref:phosphoribosylanthranilate isomerase n=1 Tax=Thalassoglobus sp. JC818 TaxID=3232136 RepID=UPI00345967DC